MSVDEPQAFVWVFNGSKAAFPSGVFRELSPAEKWIEDNRLTGTLTRYPVDAGAYDWAVLHKLFKPTKDKQRTPEFSGRFSLASFKHHHYTDGKRE